LHLQTSLGAGVTYYYTRPGDKVDFTGLFDLRVTFLATPRPTLAFGTSTAYLSQPDQTIVGGDSQQNGDLRDVAQFIIGLTSGVEDRRKIVARDRGNRLSPLVRSKNGCG
jgi:hypothetical protein